MAAIPALLYYLSVFMMVEADSRRLEVREVPRICSQRVRRDVALLLQVREEAGDVGVGGQGHWVPACAGMTSVGHWVPACGG